jgi:hypothetical protein
MATTDDEHVVQVTLGDDEYERVREQAEKEGVSVEEVLQRALRAYLAQRKHVPHHDPLFERGDENQESEERADGGERGLAGGRERSGSDGRSILDVVDDLDPSVGDRTSAENMDEYVYGEMWDGAGENDDSR